MMQSMRNSAKIVFFIVLVAFAGFMILQGLISIFSDPSQGGRIAPPGVIGLVDNAEITMAAFENTYRPRVQALYKDGQEPSDDDLERIRNEVWNHLTTVASMELEAARHNIFISNAEVAEYMRQAPPADILESPDFKTNEQFDMLKYQTWLQQLASSNNPELVRFLRNFESQIRQQVLFTRLRNFVLSMIRVTPSEVRDEFVKKNEKIKVKYILIPRDDFSSMDFDLTDADILARYEAEKEKYKQAEKAVVSYVFFTKAPGDEDYEFTRTVADSLYRELKAGADFADMAKEISEDKATAQKGGDLGWFGEGKMVKSFYEATKALKKIGDLSEPVRSQYGWHIIKLTGRRDVDSNGSSEEDKTTEYRASHILLMVETSGLTLTKLEEEANRFVQDAVVYGFRESAEDFNLPVNESKPFPEGDYIPGLGKIPEIVNFAFSSEEGDISDVIETRTAFVVCMLERKIPEGYKPLEAVKDRLKESMLRELRADEAFKMASNLVAEIESGKSFEQMAEEAGKQVQETDYFARHEFVSKVGSDPEFIGASFSLSPDRPISKAVKSASGAYIIKYLDRQPADTASFSAQLDSLMQDMIDTRNRETWTKWINSIKNKAEIVDYRTFYYGG